MNEVLVFQSSAYLISSIVNEIYLYNDPHPKSMLGTFIFNNQNAKYGFEIKLLKSFYKMIKYMIL